MRSALKPDHPFGAYTDIPWSWSTYDGRSLMTMGHNSFVFAQNKRGQYIKLKNQSGSEVNHKNGYLVSFSNAFELADNCDNNWNSQSFFHEKHPNYERPPHSEFNENELKTFLAGGYYFQCVEVEVY